MDTMEIFPRDIFMANVKAKKAVRESSRRQPVSQDRKHAEKAKAFREKQTKGTTSKIVKSIKAAQKKDIKKNLYSETSKKNVRKEIRNILERDFLKLRRVDQEKIHIKQQISYIEEQAQAEEQEPVDTKVQKGTLEYFLEQRTMQQKQKNQDKTHTGKVINFKKVREQVKKPVASKTEKKSAGKGTLEYFLEQRTTQQKQKKQDKTHIGKVINFKKVREQVKKPVASKTEKKSAGNGKDTQKNFLKRDLYKGFLKDIGTLEIRKTVTNKMEDFLEQRFLKQQQIDEDKILAEKELSFRQWQQQEQKPIEPETIKEEPIVTLKEKPLKPEPIAQEEALADKEPGISEWEKEEEEIIEPEAAKEEPIVTLKEKPLKPEPIAQEEALADEEPGISEWEKEEEETIEPEVAKEEPIVTLKEKPLKPEPIAQEETLVDKEPGVSEWKIEKQKPFDYKTKKKELEDFLENELLKLKQIDKEKILVEEELRITEKQKDKQKIIEPETIKENLEEKPLTREPITQEEILAEEELRLTEKQKEEQESTEQKTEKKDEKKAFIEAMIKSAKERQSKVKSTEEGEIEKKAVEEREEAQYIQKEKVSEETEEVEDLKKVMIDSLKKNTLKEEKDMTPQEETRVEKVGAAISVADKIYAKTREATGATIEYSGDVVKGTFKLGATVVGGSICLVGLGILGIVGVSGKGYRSISKIIPHKKKTEDN